MGTRINFPVEFTPILIKNIRLPGLSHGILLPPATGGCSLFRFSFGPNGPLILEFSHENYRCLLKHELHGGLFSQELLQIKRPVQTSSNLPTLFLLNIVEGLLWPKQVNIHFVVAYTAGVYEWAAVYEY